MIKLALYRQWANAQIEDLSVRFQVVRVNVEADDGQHQHVYFVDASQGGDEEGCVGEREAIMVGDVREGGA